MKKKMSGREKGLLIILAVIVLMLVYYKGVYEPLTAEIDMIVSETSNEQIVVEQDSVIAAKMNQMQDVVDEVKESGQGNPIPQFDNSTALMNELYSILATADKYTLTFGTVTQPEDSYIADRPVQMHFETENYDQACSILDSIEGCPYVNQISDLEIDFPTYDDGATVWNVFNYSGDSWGGWDPVSVNLTVTFYEVVE